MSANRELRQLDLVDECVRSYQDQAASLGAMVATIDALTDQFPAAPVEWVSQLRSNWWTLEQVRAVALDRQLVEIPADLLALIEGALGTRTKKWRNVLPFSEEALQSMRNTNNQTYLST